MILVTYVLFAVLASVFGVATARGSLKMPAYESNQAYTGGLVISLVVGLIAGLTMGIVVGPWYLHLPAFCAAGGICNFVGHSAASWLWVK